MKSLVREAMEEGAWALSTGLDYPPGAYADTDELIELSRVAARLGGFYHTHTRSALLARGHLAPWHEALEIGRRAEPPVHLTHYRQGRQGVGSHLDYLGLVEDARDEGLDVTVMPSKPSPPGGDKQTPTSNEDNAMTRARLTPAVTASSRAGR